MDTTPNLAGASTWRPAAPLVCIGHSHSRNVAAAAEAAGVETDVLDFWHLQDPLVTLDGTLGLRPELAARLVGPVFSLVGGAVHQDVGLMVHPRRFDFVWPERPDLPLDPLAETIPFDAVHAAMLERTRYYLDVMGAVRAAAAGAVFHIESPPTYAAEELPQDDPGFYYFFGATPTFSPPWLRYKLWRLHSAIVRAHAEAIDMVFVPHPQQAVDEDGFLREAFHGTPAHANDAYGTLVLEQMLHAVRALPTGAGLARTSRSGHVSAGTAEGLRAMDGVQTERRPQAGPAATADALAAQGDYPGAIAAASDALRRAPDAELAHRLVGWRRAGFAAARHAPPRDPWPPMLADPFPDQAGIPSVTRDALTGDLLGGAILHHGSLRVNGLVSPDVAARLRAGIDDALAARQAAAEGAPDGSGMFNKVTDDHLAMHRVFGKDGGVWAADCPPMHFEMVEALRQTGITDHIESYLGERPSLSVLKSTLRRQAVIKSADWHQDGAFLGSATRSVNVWLALSPCGVDAAGLDVVGGRVPYVMQTGSHGANLYWTVGTGLVDVLEQGGATVESPHFEPGDALVFDHFMLHRTGCRPDMTKMRWAIECWFFAPSAFPMEQIPLML